MQAGSFEAISESISCSHGRLGISRGEGEGEVSGSEGKGTEEKGMCAHVRQMCCGKKMENAQSVRTSWILGSKEMEGSLTAHDLPRHTSGICKVGRRIHSPRSTLQGVSSCRVCAFRETRLCSGLVTVLHRCQLSLELLYALCEDLGHAQSPLDLFLAHNGPLCLLLLEGLEFRLHSLEARERAARRWR